VLSDYLEKNAVTQAEALNRLQFNRSLLRQTPRDWMTSLTKDHNRLAASLKASAPEKPW